MSSELTSPPQSNPAHTAMDPIQAETYSRWRENPERMAWLVILGSFIVFAALLIAVPLSINYAIRYVTVGQDVVLEPTLGTLLLYPTKDAEPIAVTTPRDDIGAGSRIVAADESTQGSLGLVSKESGAEILGSVQIYPSTDLEIVSVRRPYFEASSEPQVAKLRLNAGQARIFTNTGDQRPLLIALETPNGTIELGTGSYRVSVDDAGTDVTVRSGEAEVIRSQEDRVLLAAGERAWLTPDELSQISATTEQNLIRNGDFSQPTLDSWKAYGDAERVTPGEVRIIERDGRRVVHFIRQGEENVHTEVGIFQEVGKNVSVFDSLVLQLDVRLMHQSLAGAGFLNSEFPLRVEITYTDIYGKQLRWGYGFYFRQPDDPNLIVTGGERIPPFNWYTYQSPDLMQLLADTPPARIDSIRIYASGWNYQSMVSEVYLLAQ